MLPFLAATGPGFHQGLRLKSLQSVDVYPLMCRLLSVPAQPNNGSLTRARCLLAGETCWDVALVIGLVVGVLLLLTIITGKSEQSWILEQFSAQINYDKKLTGLVSVQFFSGAWALVTAQTPGPSRGWTFFVTMMNLWSHKPLSDLLVLLLVHLVLFSPPMLFSLRHIQGEIPQVCFTWYEVV